MRLHRDTVGWLALTMRQLLLAILLAGCAATLTPAQLRTRDDFDACKREVRAPTAWLANVGPEGQFEVNAYGPAELRGIYDCMAQRGHRMM
jgi:hypothetical protein